MIILSGLFLLVVGGVGGYQLASFPKWVEMQQNRAIQNHFHVKANEYTYFVEGVEDGFILSLQDTEYRIKFSSNKPLKVVYVEELEPMKG
ncbi:hypothetical protein [Enterococcus faecalis]|uniref:hypothetical protein n=1 Tax=Enterococcus faecalis TaxID=1351 RepID=UPI0034D2A45A